MSLRAALDAGQIEALLRERGGARYGGEPVSQLDHALQTASAAEQAGADAALLVACLLHDLGHLLADAEGPATQDDAHERLALPALRCLPAAVLAPIALHVQAKRYLCQAEPGYAQRLSPASRDSLALQGGPMSAAEAASFRALPHAEAAIQLRRFDDEAKQPGRPTPPLEHFLVPLRALLQEAS